MKKLRLSLFFAAYPLYLEVVGLVGLTALLAFFLAASWRKWPDPLIDYGRELYTPWRLSQGAVLYRDVDDFYGPLSHYFDASLFTLFGPSLMVLVTANIIIFIAIAALIYHLFRGAWGMVPALVAGAVFISVFGFSQFTGYGFLQYTGGGNFNYATPYSQETTHGMLVCLLLVWTLVRWVESKAFAWSFLAGFLSGITLVLKPEIAFAGAASIIAAILARFRLGRPLTAVSMAAMGCGAIFPTLGFVIYFGTQMSWTDAVGGACRAWLYATRTHLADDAFQMSCLGLDQPWIHLEQQSIATLWACLFIALIAGISWLVERTARKWLQILAVFLMTAGMLWAAIYEITWIQSGRCLPGLMAIYLAACLVVLFRGERTHTDRHARLIRFLIAVLAAALLARMILNARLFHYGYYQAALAAIMVPAFLIGELPHWIGVGKKGMGVIAIGTVALLTPGVVDLCTKSHEILALKTLPVGTGGDEFLAPSPQVDPTGEMVNAITHALREAPPNQTLLVLPEGEMINYLARRPNPIKPFMYYDLATVNGGEDRIVEDLSRHPPDWVVLISRSLLEFHILRYGDKHDEGAQILDWVKSNYGTVASEGGDPLDYREYGVILLARKSSSP